jgi:hypothetical protein
MKEYFADSETRPYLKVKEVEIIIRMDLLSMEPNIKYGNYELLLEKDWIKVYVTIPRINTSGKPLHRMELSASDSQVHKLLRIYKRVAENERLQLRDSQGRLYQVEYFSVQKRNSIYITGDFLVKETNEMLCYQCSLYDGTRITGYSIEQKREGIRWVYLDMHETTFRDSCKFLQSVEKGEVLIEEIL